MRVSYIIPIFLFLYSLAALAALSPKALPVTEGHPKEADFEHLYSVSLKEYKVEHLAFKIDYKSWQNPIFTFVLSRPFPSQNCLPSLEFLPKRRDLEGGVIVVDLLSKGGAKETDYCNEYRVDFSKHLKEGHNKIVILGLNNLQDEFQAKKDGLSVYVDSKLLGGYWPSTLASLVVVLSVSWFMFSVARNAGFDGIVSTFFAGAFVYFSLWLLLRPNATYTPDLSDHLNYIYYMAKSIFANPYEYNQHISFHPPLYYFVAARVVNFSTILGGISEITALRFSTLVLYMFLPLYGLRTLALFVRPKGAAYYTGAALILLWPLAVDKASNISNDVPLFVAWAASFYYLCRWTKTLEPRLLCYAMAWAGLGFMIKSSIMLMVLMIAVLVMRMLLKRRVAFKTLITTREYWIGCGILAFGMIFNMGRVIYHMLVHEKNVASRYFGGGHNDVYPLSYYLSFDVASYVEKPFVTFFSETSLWSYFLKTFLYSPFSRVHHAYAEASVMNVLLLVFLGVIFGFILVGAFKKLRFAPTFVCSLSFFTCFLGVVCFLLVEKYQHCQNFRYVYPVLVPMAILYSQAMSELALYRIKFIRGDHPLALLAGTIIFGGMYMYLTKYPLPF
jgi:hypothetical protein